MRLDQLDGPLPDVLAHQGGVALGVQQLAEPANSRRLFQGLQRAVGQVEDQQKDPAQDSQPDHCDGQFALAEDQGQGQGQEEQADHPAQSRAAAAAHVQGNHLDRSGEDVHGCPGNVPAQAGLLPQNGPEGSKDPANGQREDHDQVGRHKDRVAHVGRDPDGGIAAPRHRVAPVTLQDAVQRDRQTGQDDGGQQALELGPPAKVGRQSAENNQVREGGVGALQALVGTPETGGRRHREDRGDQVHQGDGQHRQNHRDQQEGFELRFSRWQLFPARPAGRHQLDQPGSQDDQGQGAQPGDLIRLEDPARKHIEEDRHQDDGHQPGGFHDPIGVTAQFIGHKCLSTCFGMLVCKGALQEILWEGPRLGCITTGFPEGPAKDQ